MRILAAALLLHCALAQAQSAEWKQLNQRAWDQQRAGKLDEAVATARQMVEMSARESVGVQTDSLNDLAEIHRLQGRYALAEPLYRQAIAMWEKDRPPEHRAMAAYLNNLGLALEALTRYAEAETVLQRALAIRMKLLGPQHNLIAQTLLNLALTFRCRANMTRPRRTTCAASTCARSFSAPAIRKWLSRCTGSAT